MPEEKDWLSVRNLSTTLLLSPEDVRSLSWILFTFQTHFWLWTYLSYDYESEMEMALLFEDESELLLMYGDLFPIFKKISSISLYIYLLGEIELIFLKR